MEKSEQFYDAENKLKAYDEETRNLMAKALNLDVIDFKNAFDESVYLPEIVYLLRRSFKERVTHLKVLGEKDMRSGTDVSSGFCMFASYLIYSMTGGDKIWELRGTNLHWWLYHKQTQTVFDITRSQFPKEDLSEIYAMGQPVKKLKKDELFYDVLKAKAKILAQRAGLE